MFFAVKPIFDPGSRCARPEEDRVVKSVWMKSILACVVVATAAGLAFAQNFNPPPCDFSNQFYGDNGVLACTDSTCSTLAGELNTEPDGRFGSFRQFGPPATTSNQANWVADPNCSANDPTRRNFRILATTGAFKDDSGAPTEFFSIMAFVHSQNFFEPTYNRVVGANGTGSGSTISVVQGFDPATGATGAVNPRSIAMQDIVGNFEAYGAPKQTITLNGQHVLAPTPCGSLHDPGVAANDCFPTADGKNPDGSTLSNAATPNIRQDWRVSSNRNAMDGSDNNCITKNDQLCKHKGSFHDTPFGYFCDDLLGMWIITYFWFTDLPAPNTVNPTCAQVYHDIGTKNGFNLDGTPIILTAHELNDELEANNCGAEGQEDPAGGDGGAIWLVCPAIPDPRNGAIASDAFLDAVRTSGGSFLDPTLAANFTCLQQTGQFCQ